MPSTVGAALAFEHRDVAVERPQVRARIGGQQLQQHRLAEQVVQ